MYMYHKNNACNVMTYAIYTENVHKFTLHAAMAF